MSSAGAGSSSGGAAGPGPGDELVCFQGGPVSLQASAQGQQEVGAGIDKAGLRLADHVIHRSKEQQEQCQLVNEGAGQTAVGEAVILPETVKKGGGLELVKAGYPGGHLPVQGGGGGGAVGIDGVVELHMTGVMELALSACHTPRAQRRK